VIPTWRALVLLLWLTPFLIVGASLPHLHADTEAGLWNHDHDLTLMAAFGSQASPADAMALLGPAPVLAATIALAPTRPPAVLLRSSASRAPPAP
jgi:hypothetical protein